MADRDEQAGFIRQFLQLQFPQSHACSVTAASVRDDQSTVPMDNAGLVRRRERPRRLDPLTPEEAARLYGHPELLAGHGS